VGGCDLAIVGGCSLAHNIVYVCVPVHGLQLEDAYNECWFVTY